ncbi:MAG TPA: hypothetical protein DCM28_18520 [Phycisphaerales bacterium]|nr:hypothetical protein [Phycisphaerales bacterium]HCD32299.1 hypothetical protein [Phycisphaerales bacterium]|tara:strand:- start:984 stop:1202 length:219 start_codon:yes stop_codon:yes gene_type:complete
MPTDTIIIEITPSEDGFRAQSFGQEPRVVGTGESALAALDDLVNDWHRARTINPDFNPGPSASIPKATVARG